MRRISSMPALRLVELDLELGLKAKQFRARGALYHMWYIDQLIESLSHQLSKRPSDVVTRCPRG